MFIFKKAISLFIMPFPIFLILLGIGYYFWRRHRPKQAKKTLIAAVIWITLLSYPPFSALLLYPLENNYPKIDLTQTTARYIHVLGSGHISNQDIPLSSQLGLVSLARVNEGVSIYNRSEEMKIIFSGYGKDDPVSNARKNSQMASLLKVKPQDIILLENARDTKEEAIAVKKIIHDQPLILVTSAAHMPRAVSLFRQSGIDVIPAPTDFRIKETETLWQLPSAGGLSSSETAFHEYLGIGWSKLVGWVSNFAK